MKVNYKILSIPPYISTSWRNVSSLHVEYRNEQPILNIVLTNGQKIDIPGLDSPVIEGIFGVHEKFMEQEAANTSAPGLPIAGIEQFTLNFPFKLGLTGLNGIEGMGTLLQHNPEQADSPQLPPEILEKISQLTKTMGADEGALLPKPEPHCNCVHCQIARAMQENGEGKVEPVEEEVTEEDLKFRSWEISQIADKLFVVTDPLNDKEKYNVYLGKPVGCTCGQDGCEHIQAVLRS